MVDAAAGAPVPELNVQVSARDGYAGVVAAGAIELATGDVLDERLAQAAELTRAAVLLDLGVVTFLESSGLNVSGRWHHKLNHQGTTLVSCGAADRVTRVLAITGLGRALYLRLGVT